MEIVVQRGVHSWWMLDEEMSRKLGHPRWLKTSVPAYQPKEDVRWWAEKNFSRIVTWVTEYGAAANNLRTEEIGTALQP